MNHRVILPGSTIGVLGSGQLGRMFALAARRMGYRIHTFSPDVDSPTGQVADVEICAQYEDLDAVRAFARNVDVVTFEFENVHSATAEAAAECVTVRPAGQVLHTTQHRLREKTFLSQHGFPVVPHATVRSEADLSTALVHLGTPAVLKTAGWGYDGKGQAKIRSLDDATAAWKNLATHEAIVEAFVSFDRELSVVAARGIDGAIVDYGAIENAHVNHILDVSTAPAGISAQIANAAREITHAVLKSLDVVGVLCVEFFLTRSGELLINELAPRPHNSGHLTIDACVTSQFDQQVRAVCGLPLGSTAFIQPAAMVNLLGDVWTSATPDWAKALAMPGVHLHLYGKTDPRSGRKMGHITATASTVEKARELALAARSSLSR